MDDPAKAPLNSSPDKIGLVITVVGLTAALAGLGCLVSPFYLPGGVIGVLNGDRPINQMSDGWIVHVTHSLGSMVLGLFLAAGGAAVKFVGLGIFVGAAAAKPNHAAQTLPPPENLSPPPSS